MGQGIRKHRFAPRWVPPALAQVLRGAKTGCGQALPGTWQKPSAHIRALGYPNKATFRQWLDKALPEQKGLHSKRRLEPRVELTTEQKQAAIVDLGSREGPAREVAEKYGVSRVALYRWKNELLGKERPVTKQEHRKPIDSDDKDVLLAKVESLKEQVKALEKQVYRLRLEKDVLEVTAELLKKARAPIPRN